MDEQDIEQFSYDNEFISNIDAFADETGYEEVKQSYTNFADFYNYRDEDDDEPQNSYMGSDTTDPFGNNFSPDEDGNDGHPNQDSTVEETIQVSQSRNKKARDNSFKPYENSEIHNENDDDFRPYDLNSPHRQPSLNKMNKSEEGSVGFVGYNNQNASEKSKDKQSESSSPEKSSFENSLGPQTLETDGPVFQKVNKDDLPSTIRVDSFLSKELNKLTLDDNYFTLPPPDANDKTAIKVKMYLFEQKDFREVHTTSKVKVLDVIKHMITILKLEQTDPQAYEIRIIDDDESYYAPFYDIAALETKEPIGGSFKSLAFVKNKKYQPPKMARVDELNFLGQTSSSMNDKNIFKVYIQLQFLTTTVDIDMDEYEFDHSSRMTNSKIRKTN